MIDVTTKWGLAIAIAGVSGMVGGLVYDLILDRFGDSGLLEWLKTVKNENGGRTYFDVGFAASVIVGGVAAIGFLFFMPPEVRTEVVKEAGKADVSKVVREYDPFRLIAATLIVGTGGVSFVKAMRERLLKLVNATKLSLLSGTVQDVVSATKEGLGKQRELLPADQAAEAIHEANGRLDMLNALAKRSTQDQ
jgi:hypothetical protein